MDTKAEIAQLRTEFGLSHDGDSWGHVMHWWFSIADELHYREGVTPEHWHFKPSPLGRTNDPDDYVSNVVCEAGADALVTFGNILTRYAQALRRAGKDY